MTAAERRSNVLTIVALLAAAMIGCLALWSVIELLLPWQLQVTHLALLHAARSITTALVMSGVTAYLLVRYRRGYEQALRAKSEEAHRVRVLYENIVQDAAEAIVAVDVQGKVKSWNRAAARIYGWTAAEMAGQSVHRLVPPDLLARGEIEEMAHRVEAEGAIVDYETRRVRKDGAIIRVRITRSLLRDADGTPIGSTAIVRDVTAEREMEERLLQAEKLAAIGQAAASMAHEVRNALAGISGTLEVLQTTALWRELPEEVGTEMMAQVARIANTVQDVLSYARPRVARPAHVDLNAVVERALVSNLAVCCPDRINLVRDYGTGPLTADADSGQLEQALGNLFQNACQAMEKGGYLTVSTRRSSGGARIEISDTGPGMTGEILSRAFEPFYTTRARGTGLGLPIARGIIEAHGGTLTLDNPPAGGTRAVITVPLAAGDERRAETHADASAA